MVYNAWKPAGGEIEEFSHNYQLEYHFIDTSIIMLTNNKQNIIHKDKQEDHSHEDHSNNYRS